ncbi:hypothetical protein BGX34_011325 [Mortierella sp. NVP85]|nr:hypothetical protein BGX34_011325 [Mortierella sp. NVP85]
MFTPTKTPPMKLPGGADQTSENFSTGAYPQRLPSPQPESTQSPTAKTGHIAQSASSDRSRAELSFQFDRHVQEIRRRRTVEKNSTPPDRGDFVREAEGKQVLDVWLYAQAYITYYIESLARDDKVRKIEPLQWSRIKALLSRLYDTSNSTQSLGFYVERVMYWRNPPETLVWFIIYFTLWFYKLWLPGFISLVVIKMLNNRFGFLGNFKKRLNVPGSLSENIKHKEHKKTKVQSQLRELIHSKDLTDWISQMMKIWGPYCQALLEANIGYFERLKK